MTSDPSETRPPIVAALREEGDAWDADSHYLADLLHGAADEIERLRGTLAALADEYEWLTHNHPSVIRKHLPLIDAKAVLS